MMNSAREGPIAANGFESQRSYRPVLASVRTESPSCENPAALGESLGVDGGKVGASGPDGPDDASHLVGEGDGGLVVAARAFAVEGPRTQAIGSEGRLRMTEGGAGAV